MRKVFGFYGLVACLPQSTQQNLLSPAVLLKFFSACRSRADMSLFEDLLLGLGVSGLRFIVRDPKST